MTGPIGRLLELEAFPLSAGAGASPLVVVSRSLKVAGNLRPPSGKMSVSSHSDVQSTLRSTMSFPNPDRSSPQSSFPNSMSVFLRLGSMPWALSAFSFSLSV